VFLRTPGGVSSRHWGGVPQDNGGPEGHEASMRRHHSMEGWQSRFISAPVVNAFGYFIDKQALLRPLRT
jgi:hypothetical protein